MNHSNFTKTNTGANVAEQVERDLPISLLVVGICRHLGITPKQFSDFTIDKKQIDDSAEFLKNVIKEMAGGILKDLEK